MSRIRIDVFSHNVKCSEFDSQIKQYLLGYTSRCARVDMVPDPNASPGFGGRRRMIRKIVKVFAALTHDRKEFRFHIHQYQDLMQALQANGVWEKDMTIVHHDVPAYAPLALPLIDTRTPRDYQIEKIDYLKQDQKTKILIAQTGSGKAQSLDSKILTPSGWSTMGDQRIGDPVTVPGGGTAHVIGVYPQGLKDVYRIRLEGGYETEACLEHLWLARLDRTHETVVNTQTLLEHLKKGTVHLPVGPGAIGSLWVRVRAIEYSRNTQTQCIAIDSPEKLYITDDYIVTHNTMMSLRAIHHRNKRVFLALTRNTYMSKWVEDLEETYDCKKGDIVVIKGAKQLSTLIECAKNDDLDAKIIICSMRTLQMYIDKYESGEDVVAEYGCVPEDFFPTLQVGIRFIDEVHEHFHTVYKLDLYTHVSETINLTATLIDDNVFVERMMRVMFPHNIRPPASPYDKYIETVAYRYGLSDKGRRYMRWSQPGRGSYSHVRFEKSLLKNRKYLNRYLDFVYEIAEQTYFSRKEGKQKLLIFSSTIAMCDEVRKYFQKRCPDMTVARYTSEDAYSTLETSDIICSTLLSSGTAVDIPDLRTAIMTVAIGSRRMNAQALGRLRRLSRYPDTTPTFAYMVCADIDEHLKYYDKKVELFEDKTLVHKVEHTSFNL